MGTPILTAVRDTSSDGAFLSRLGERVRAWRAEHAMTRKSLALASGVSERYLAQLESGAGNMSVLLLRKLAHAMQVPIEDLVREPADAPRDGRIALIGLRGAGKSSVGVRLAQALELPFVELDHEIEREAGTALGDIFSMYGQDAYRRFERRALERVLHAYPRAVIATGGSIVTAPQTYELLLRQCRCVWLKASPEDHMSRVIAQGDMRPFKGRSPAVDEIRQLLASRDPLYARADLTIDTSARTAHQTLADLRAALAHA